MKDIHIFMLYIYIYMLQSTSIRIKNYKCYYSLELENPVNQNSVISDKICLSLRNQSNITIIASDFINYVSGNLRRVSSK